MKDRSYFLKSSSQNPLYVKKDEKLYYGGSQMWYGNKKRIYNGCGPIAAANIIYYLKQKKKAPISYKKTMEDLYKRINPGLIGLTSINKFIREVLSYGRYVGLYLNVEKLEKNNWNFNYQSALSFIINGIIRDVPVAAFNLDFRKKSKFSWHWIVITGVTRESGEDYIFLSSWGRKYKLSFEKYFNSMKYGGGFVYFY